MHPRFWLCYTIPLSRNRRIKCLFWQCLSDSKTIACTKHSVILDPSSMSNSYHYCSDSETSLHVFGDGVYVEPVLTGGRDDDDAPQSLRPRFLFSFLLCTRQPLPLDVALFHRTVLLHILPGLMECFCFGQSKQYFCNH